MNIPTNHKNTRKSRKNYKINAISQHLPGKNIRFYKILDFGYAILYFERSKKYNRLLSLGFRFTWQVSPIFEQV